MTQTHKNQFVSEDQYHEIRTNAALITKLSQECLELIQKSQITDSKYLVTDWFRHKNWLRQIKICLEDLVDELKGE